MAHGSPNNDALKGVIMELCFSINENEGVRLVAAGTKYGVLGALVILINVLADSLECEIVDVLHAAFDIQKELEGIESQGGEWISDFVELVRMENKQEGTDNIVKGMN